MTVTPIEPKTLPNAFGLLTEIQNYLSTNPHIVFTVAGVSDTSDEGSAVYALYGPGGDLLYAGTHSIVGPMLMIGVNPEIAKYGIKFTNRWVNEEWFDTVGYFPENMRDVVWA